MRKLFSNTKLILIVIVLIASFLRLYKLTVNPPSLFGDELDLGYQAYSILKTGKDYQGNLLPLNFHSLAEWRTPMYLYSSVPTVAIFGITPLGVRLPAAIFGILDVLVTFYFVKALLTYKQPPSSKHYRSLLAAFLMAISPWALQYSRAGFEVTEMLFFLITGLWLFIKSLDNGKWLWLSAVCLILTPWVYSTAKFFTPILLIFLFILYRKEIFSLGKSNLIKTIVAGLVVGLPLAYATLLGGGAQRFSYISVFADPTTEANIGAARQMAARVRGEMGAGLTPSLIDKLVYNKFTYWGDKLIKNYLSAFSTDFLFIKGDPDLRQSIGIGELYRIEIVALVIGIIFFFSEKGRDTKIKWLIGFLILAAPIPSALTVDGGNHATRLILMLPVLIFLISYGWLALINKIPHKFQSPTIILIILGYLISIFFYLHEYYVAYPWDSERWWHYGWCPAVTEIKSVDSNYDRVFISMSGEPAWIFFAGCYQYPPSLWQKNFPIGNNVNVAGFGSISHTGKYYFGSPESSVQIYGLSRYITSRDLYLANASEVGANLIMEPKSVPTGLRLIKTIAFPSGEPAFYIFTKAQ